jgi:uncharacterized protein YraI
MQTTRLLAALALLLALGLTTSATGAQTATVQVAEVEVRSGPSANFYPTSRLRQGQVVEVVREENGWLAIKPPPGSFSWIDRRAVQEHGATVTVKEANAPVRVGSRLINREPEVQKLRVQAGTQLVVIGRPEVSQDGTVFLPIQPPANDVRYLPVEAVRPTTPTSPPAVSPPSANFAAVGDARWQQALQLEQLGRSEEAARLYADVGIASAANPGLAAEAQRRAQWLRGGLIQSPAGTTRENRPAGTVSWGAVNAPAAPAGRTTSQYTDGNGAAAPAWRPPAQAPAPATAPGQPAGSPAMLTNSGPGRLYRAPFFIDNKPAFGLEGSGGQLRLYVTAEPGVNLEPFVNRNVDLHGSMLYRGDLRTNYMTVRQVTPLP